MRTPKRVETQAGDRWVLRYRDAEGRQTSQRSDEDVEATKFAPDLDRYGPDKAGQLLYARLAPVASGAPKLNAWIDTYISTRSRASAGTRAKYRTNWDRSFGPRLGFLPIDQITGDDVARAVMELSEIEGLSDKTVANYHGVLAGAMKIAHGRGLIPINPCLEVALPRRTEHEQTEPRFLTPEEYEQLHSVFHQHFLPLLHTAGTGIRWGEAAALTHATLPARPRRCGSCGR